METTSSFSVSNIPHLQENRIEIGNQVYLASENSIAIRTEVLFEKIYERKKVEGIETFHFFYEASFNLHGRLLEILAVSKTSYGPAGDRLRLDVTYDGETIGNYRALISYMGGGSQGQWPCIRTPDWILTFTFTSTGFNSKKNQIQIEYYKVIIPGPAPATIERKSKRISPIDLPDGFVDDIYDIENLEIFKCIHWRIPVVDPISHTPMGTLSYCSYPEFERYWIPPSSFNKTLGHYANSSPSAKYIHEKLMNMLGTSTDGKEFIGRSKYGNYIKQFEYEYDGSIHWHSLEGNTCIKPIK